MSRPSFALLWIAIVALVFLAMWLGWRARSRRDSSVLTAAHAPTGAPIAEFDHVLYVSTTPVGEPLSRVAAPGLRYRGQCEIVVRDGGVTVQIRGEDPIYFEAAMLRGSAAAGRRVGKAVEHGGLALMRWVPESDDANTPRELESSFRFEHKTEQERFAKVLDDISQQAPSSQEDEK